MTKNAPNRAHCFLEKSREIEQNHADRDHDTDGNPDSIDDLFVLFVSQVKHKREWRVLITGNKKEN